MPNETGEGKVSQEWVGEASVFGLGILPPVAGKTLHSKNVAGAFHTDWVTCTLSAVREVKTEIPAEEEDNHETFL